MRAGLVLLRERKRLVSNRLANPAAANALGANSHRANFATRQRRLDRLKVWQEASTGDSGNLGTDTTQILCLTSGLNHVANLRGFSANFTSSSHDKPVSSDSSKGEFLLSRVFRRARKYSQG